MGHLVAKNVFPYDSVYFKAQTLQEMLQSVTEYFHTIPSILKLCSFSEHPSNTYKHLGFPYDSVYFKALQKLIMDGVEAGVFPYDSVYFKAFVCL